MTSSFTGSILVVDDEPIVRESLAVYLSDSGFDVHTAKSGDEGLALFRNLKPDLVICDLRMPLFDGLDVLKAINAEAAETPVIVVSGQGSMDDVVNALRLGAVDYLFKPLIEMEVLEHSIRRALERGHLLKQNKVYAEQLELANEELEKSLELLEQDQEAGRRVQQRMLPPTPYTHGQTQFSHRIIPSLYLSGDFVDYFKLGNNRTAFYLADVSGHGASSAFVTVFLKTLTNRIQRHYEKRTTSNLLSPGRILASINQELISMALGKHLAMFCGVIDEETNTLTYCLGAHYPPPILVNGDNVMQLEGRGLPVGIFADAAFDDIQVQLEKEFTLVAMSDGVLEVLMPGSTNDQKEAKLIELVQNGVRDVDALASVLNVDGEVEVPDDIAFLVINRAE